MKDINKKRIEEIKKLEKSRIINNKEKETLIKYYEREEEIEKLKKVLERRNKQLYYLEKYKKEAQTEDERKIITQYENFIKNHIEGLKWIIEEKYNPF